MTLSLIPRPAELQQHGGALLLGRLRSPETSGAAADFPARWLSEVIEQATGQRLAGGPLSSQTATFTLKESAEDAAGPEGYTLRITEQGIDLQGPPAGLARGAATLAQLIGQSPVQLPTLTIRDWPRFPYRGLMVDVARHFLPLSEIKV